MKPIIFQKSILCVSISFVQRTTVLQFEKINDFSKNESNNRITLKVLFNLNTKRSNLPCNQCNII